MRQQEEALPAFQDGTENPPGLSTLRQAVKRYLKQQNLSLFCDIDINTIGQWFAFEGQIDSHTTRSILFSMVPKQNGSRYVIDRLRVDGSIGSDF